MKHPSSLVRSDMLIFHSVPHLQNLVLMDFCAALMKQQYIQYFMVNICHLLNIVYLQKCMLVRHSSEIQCATNSM